MNVLYLQDHGEIGGAQLSLLDLLAGLRMAAPEIHPTVVVGKDGFLLERLQTQHFPSEVWRFPEYRKWKHLFQRHDFMERLAEFCRTKKIDVVHANTLQVAPWSAAVGARLKIKSCCTIREVVDVRQMKKYCLFEQDQLIAISSAVKNNLPPELLGRCRQIYNCIAPAGPPASKEELTFRGKFPPKAPLVGFMGKISERKGIAFLIDAIPEVLQAIPTAHFLFLGTGAPDYLAKMTARLTALNITEHVTFCGELKNGAGYLHLLDVFVLPSFTEGLGRVTVEAMFAGLPVVATNTGGTLEIVDPDVTGRLVPPKNSGALAEQIIFYLKNGTIGKQHGAAGKKRAGKLFGLENNARSVGKLYRALMESENGRPSRAING
ncbi:MAG: glycosyltransferase family 4 protein [Verrucomicrobiota bacterium]